jgi:hypothetical protein
MDVKSVFIPKEEQQTEGVLEQSAKDLVDLRARK